MSWFIGQEIVCIKNHSALVVKEGDVLTIKSLTIGLCKCSHVWIDVGKYIPSTFDQSREKCLICGYIFNTDRTLWFIEKLFAPLDSLADISELTEVLNQPAFK